jgi:hypothetical protein
MGILYNSVMAEMKREFLLERFTNRGILRTEDGRPLDTLSYDELKCEYVLQAFRDIDTEKDENKWF